MSGLVLDPDQHWMQFHITRTIIGPQNETCWVRRTKFDVDIPSHVRLPGCTCTEFLEVMKCDGEKYEAARLSLEPGNFLFICRCYGEFAE